MKVRDVLEEIVSFAQKHSDAAIRSGVKEETVAGQGQKVLVLEGAALEFVKREAAHRLGLENMIVGNARSMPLDELARKIAAWNEIVE
jgi:hypothetical protein